MPRIGHAKSSHKRKKKFLKLAKGQFGHRSRRYRQARRSIIKSLVYAYRDRKVRKRDFRHLWILRINAACRSEGISYSRFIKGLTDAKVGINRKMIADLAVHSLDAFKQLVTIAKDSVAAKVKK